VIVIEGGGYRSLYAHLDTILASGLVEQGQVIATCGNTGRDTTGPHLHFAVESLQNL
jgi:murein DD-endopeptidase MepM/ murein hydrolase activator NlpD